MPGPQTWKSRTIGTPIWARRCFSERISAQFQYEKSKLKVKISLSPTKSCVQKHPVKTTAVTHSGMVRLNRRTRYGRTDCSSGRGFKLCNLKETAGFFKSWSDMLVKDSITHDDTEATASLNGVCWSPWKCRNWKLYLFYVENRGWRIPIFPLFCKRCSRFSRQIIGSEPSVVPGQ